MEIVSVLKACLEQSSPLWNVEITKRLVEEKWEELKSQNSWDPNNYSTAGFLLGDASLTAERLVIPIDLDTEDIYIEMPSQEHLSSFYKENGLELYTKEELDSLESVNILNNAFTTISTVRPIFNCVTTLVRAIQILKSGDPDNDVSYSHPNIPFSIFVSICDKQTEEATLRIAESIIHEAMHLQLTLIENYIDLVKPNSTDIYYSPWRDEKRPARGVLHGLYVFRAILEFFRELASSHSNDRVVEYADGRIKEIASQLTQIQDFYKLPALNATGAQLAQQLVSI